MKKLILSVAMLSLGTGAMAQGMYASFNLGYGLGMPGEVVGTMERVDASGNTTTTNKYGTNGAGFNIGLTPGYMFNENFGFELGLNYLLGSKVQVLDSEDNSNPLDIVKESTISKSNQFRISPTFVVTSGNDGLNVYAKAGLILPVAGSTTINQNRDDVTPIGTTETRTELSSKGAFSVGFQGALGVSYGISDKLSLFGELKSVSLRIKSKSAKVNSSTTAGVNNLAGVPAYGTDINFVDELSASSNNLTYNPTGTNLNAAKDDLATRSNFNALFINLGVKFNF